MAHLGAVRRLVVQDDAEARAGLFDAVLVDLAVPVHLLGLRRRLHHAVTLRSPSAWCGVDAKMVMIQWW